MQIDESVTLKEVFAGQGVFRLWRPRCRRADGTRVELIQKYAKETADPTYSSASEAPRP